MIRSFNLPNDEYELNGLLNNDKIRAKHIRVNCDKKTSTTLILVDYIELKEQRTHIRTRKIERFHLLNGEDDRLNRITNSDEFRIVHRYDFLTDGGVVVVIDYEDKRT